MEICEEISFPSFLRKMVGGWEGGRGGRGMSE